LLDKSNGLNNWFVLPVNVGGTLLSGETMSQTKLRSFNVIFVDVFQDLSKVGPDSPGELSDRLVERSCNARLRENFLTHFWISHSKQEFLLL